MKITGARVRSRPRDVLGLRHVHLRRDSCCFFRASCFNTYLVRTPPQENFAPFFIRLKIASSPSWLMTVRLHKSMTSLRPPSSWFAFLQVVLSSATQAPVRLPSTISVRRDGVSAMEINMLRLCRAYVSTYRNTVANATWLGTLGKLLNLLMTGRMVASSVTESQNQKLRRAWPDTWQRIFRRSRHFESVTSDDLLLRWKRLC